MHYSASLALVLTAASAAAAIPAQVARDFPRLKGGKPIYIVPEHPVAPISTASTTQATPAPSSSCNETVQSNTTASHPNQLLPVNGGSNHTFSVTQKPHKRVLKDGSQALAKAHLKYNRNAPRWIRTSAVTTGEVTANPESWDYEYLCAVTVGGQSLVMDFDTGSADLWVFSSEMSASSLSGHEYYSPSKSSSAKQMSGYTWTIKYGDGSTANGNVYKDTVAIGGVTVTSQAVEPAESVSSEFLSDTDSDGLVGLGFSSLNQVQPTHQTTFFDNVKASLSSPVFTADLKKGKAGTYDFGYIDSTKYKGKITYTTVDSSHGWWQFSSSGYAIGSNSKVSHSFTGIADTGTSLLLLDDTIVDAYYAKVPKAVYDDTQQAYVFPCSNTLPSLSVVINGYSAIVPGTYINYGPINSTTCYGGLQSNDKIGISIFGDVFLKSQFVVFDGSSMPRLGFAAKTLTS